MAGVSQGESGDVSFDSLPVVLCETSVIITCFFVYCVKISGIGDGIVTAFHLLRKRNCPLFSFCDDYIIIVSVIIYTDYDSLLEKGD